jgi:hypothetical protein
MSTTSDGIHRNRGESRTAAASPRDPSDTDERSRPAPVQEAGPERGKLLDRQKERFGGIKWGSAFFGWLTATGTALILTALATVAATAFGMANGADFPGQPGSRPGPSSNAEQIAGVTSVIALLVIMLAAYYCGGYVAGRMARFSGARQGFAVWLWSVVIAIVVAGLAAIAGHRFGNLAELDGLPQLPTGNGSLTTLGILVAVSALAAALIGAIVGGLTGMHYHRRVDQAGFEE